MSPTTRPRRSSSRVNNGNNSVTHGDGSLTPQDRSGKNVITPATANPSKSDAGRTSTRRSKRKSNDDDGSVDEDEVLVASNHLFTSRSSTCFKMGLDPTKDAHKKVICEGCMKVFENTPLGKFTKAIREAPTQRTLESIIADAQQYEEH
eukprot:scaffold13691_cov168-Skeletonema_marinoi.AAC.1